MKGQKPRHLSSAEAAAATDINIMNDSWSISYSALPFFNIFGETGTKREWTIGFVLGSVVWCLAIYSKASSSQGAIEFFLFQYAVYSYLHKVIK
jgi:hypothetical protein